MVKLNKIYTKTGDQGKTGLVDGTRLPKSDLRVEAYGTIDEANATIGIAISFCNDKELTGLLYKIQNHLFDLGADLATPIVKDEKPGEALRILEKNIIWLEEQIDRINKDLPALKSFILPGGSKAASFLHLARTIIRRAERQIVALQESGAVLNFHALSYTNRLSDLFFVLARKVARNEGGEILWEPAK